MKDLVLVLQKYSPSASSHLGEGAPSLAAATVDVGALQPELRAVVVRSDKLLWIWVATLVVILVLDCFLVLTLRADPSVLAALFGATGVGLAVVLSQMQRAWHQKFVTETFIVLLPAVGAEDRKHVLDQLLASLLKS